jgi:hypothetical protein
MRKALFLVFFFLFSINLVYALDCQYKDTEFYQELGTWLYGPDDSYFGEPLILKDFVGGYMNIGGCNPPSFVVYNPYDFGVIVNVSYTSFHPAINWAYPKREQKHTLSITIPPYSEQKLTGVCMDIGGSNIPNESISYVFDEPTNLVFKKGTRTSEREVCEKCGDALCLEEGAACQLDSQCGSNICSITKSCSKTKVTPCPGTTENCNDELCLEPSIKNKNEPYKCEWECISGRGENGTCIWSLEEEGKALWWNDLWNKVKRTIIVIIILAGLSLVGYFLLWKKVRPTVKKYHESKRGLVEIEEEVANLIIVKKDIEESLIFLSSELKSLQEDKKVSEGKIRRLKEKIRKAGKEAKEKLEKKLGESERIQDLRINRINEKEKEILKKKSQVNVEMNKLSNALSKRDDLARRSQVNTQKEIDAALEKYRREYSEEIIEYDKPSGYLVFSNNRKERLHRYRYRKMYWLGSGYFVHHIDKDKLNNEYWNLIALTPEEHKKVEHGKFFFKDWKQGIEILKKRVPGIKRRFHKEIRKKIKGYIKEPPRYV